MIETYSKGRDPNKIYEAFVNGLDESDYRQLAITGRYKYKGYTNEQLGEILESSNNEYTQVANSRRLDLQQQLKQIEQAIPTLKKPEEKKLYEDQKGKIVQAISKIDEQIAESNVSLNESKTKLFSDDTDYANSIRSRIHMNKFLGTLSKDFSDKSSYVKYAENPLWKANMEEQKFAFDVKYKTASLEIEKRKAAAAEKANKLKEQEVTAYSTPGAMGGGMPPTKENVYQAYDGFIKDRQGNYNKLALAAFDNDASKMEEYINVAIRGRFTDPETGKPRNRTREEVIQNIAVQEYTRIASVMNDKTGKYGNALKLNPVLVEAATQVSDLSNTISSMKATMSQIDKEAMASFPDAVNEATIMKGLKPTTVKVGNTNIALSPQDQVDLSKWVAYRREIFSTKAEDADRKTAIQRLESKFGKDAPLILNYGESEYAKMPTWGKRFLDPTKGGFVGAAMERILGGTKEQIVGEMTPFQKVISSYKSESYQAYSDQLNKRYNEVFSGFFPQNLGFVMNDKNRDIVVGKLNSTLYQNPLYTQDVRKALLDNGSQVMFTSVPSPTGFGGTTYAAVITSKDGTESEPIPITSDQYSFLAGGKAPAVDLSMTLTKARIYSSPDRSTNMQGVGSWQTSFFPGQTFTNIKGYNVGGMDLIQSTQNPNSFYPMLYVAPSGSSNYQTIPIQSSVSLSEGFNLPSILTDAKLKAMGINF
jgi:DNA-binding transcriptional MerR regulator